MPSKIVGTAIVVRVGPCIDDTDFKTLENAIAFNAAGMSVDLFVENENGITKTDLTLTTAGGNDWTFKGNAVYELEITAGQNNQEGSLYVVGICDGVLPFESPIYTIGKANPINSLIYGTDKLQVDAVEISGDAAAADDLELLVENSKGSDNKVLLSADAQTSVTIPTVTTVTNGAKSAELAKVPKSDSNVTWNSTALAAIKGEVDNSHDSAVPGAPTAHSINERVKAMDDLTQASGGGDLAAVKAKTDNIPTSPATEAKQNEILVDLVDIKGTGFAKDTDSLVDLFHTGADSDTGKTISDQMDGIGSQAGAGAITWVHKVTVDPGGADLADVDVWVTSDEAGTNTIASGKTDQNGEVTFFLDAGLVYVWRQKSGYNFTNPDEDTVVAP